MKKMIPLAGCLLILTACNVELPPIESGFTADTWVTAEGPFKSELTPEQLKNIAAWFAAHRAGWTHKITDNPPGPSVLLKHRGGKTTLVCLLGRELWVGNRYKTLSSEELSEVQAILLPKNQLPVFRR